MAAAHKDKAEICGEMNPAIPRANKNPNAPGIRKKNGVENLL